MTDILERLRAANPVADCAAPPLEEVWRKLDGRAGAVATTDTAPRRRARRLAGVPGRVTLPVGVVVAAAVAVVLLGGTDGPSVAARAYAATDSNAVIVHYVEISRVQNVRGLPGWTLSLIHI